MAARAKAAPKAAKKIDTKKKKKAKPAKKAAQTKPKKALHAKAPAGKEANVEKKTREKQYRFIANAKKNKFLNAFAKIGSVKAAAADAGIDRTTHYTWLDDESYKRAYERARQIAADALEEEARRRAVEGYIGKDGVREYSDKLLIALLKANFPDRYKERMESKVELSGAVGIVDALKEARERLKEAEEEERRDE